MINIWIDERAQLPQFVFEVARQLKINETHGKSNDDKAWLVRRKANVNTNMFHKSWTQGLALQPLHDETKTDVDC